MKKLPSQLPRSLGLALVIFAAPSLLFAQKNENSADKYSYFGKLIIPRPNTIYADSSEVLREDRLVTAHLAVGLLASELSLGLYLNPKNVVEVKYIKQKDYFSGMMDLTNASLLHFFGESFFLRGGWSWRQGTPARALSITEQINQGPIYDAGADLGVGNRWQWQYLSLGVEWLAAYIPLVNNEEQEGFSTQLRGLMVHVGIST